MIEAPVAGKHYPKRVDDLRAWFHSDDKCLDYLDWLRWGDGFACPHCGAGRSLRGGDGLRRCTGCRRRVPATVGTIFERTRTPLSVWFEAVWLLVVPKNGTSALNLSRVLPIGSYQTAWAMLAKLRSAMSVAEKAKLSGVVEVDEWMHGGVRPGVRGRGVGKNIVAAAAEQGRGGRVRFAILPDASTASLRRFITEHVEPGSTLVTDGWQPYIKAAHGYEHRPVSERRSSQQPHELLPVVHKVFSLADRWLLGTHQGGVQAEHLQEYLDEFTFRWNRRGARHRGLLFMRLLEHAVAADPVTYKDLVKIGAKPALSADPPGQRGRPGSLHVARLDRPWRTTARARTPDRVTS